MHITIAVKIPDGDTYYIEIDPSLIGFRESLDRIKAVFQRETRIPPHEQILEYCGVVLPNGNARKIEFSPLEILPKREHSELFKKSLVYVNDTEKWTWDDVKLPENKIDRYTKLQDCPDSIKIFYNDLNKPRLVEPSMAAQFQTLLASVRRMGMDDFFQVTSDSDQYTCASAVEMECYNNILENIPKQWNRVTGLAHRSPGLLSAFFASTLMFPPFLWDQTGGLQVLYDVASRVRMFVKPLNNSSFYKYFPHSDVAVFYCADDSIPFVIAEVDSNIQKQDEVRMAMQGAVASRQWRTTLDDEFKDRIMPLGLYVHSTFHIDLFLFHADENDKVEFFKKEFDTVDKKDALEVARCLFNYRDRWLETRRSYDSFLMQALESMVEQNSDLPTLTSGKRKAKKKGNLDPVPEHPENPPNTVLQAAATVVCPVGTHIEFTKRENVASVKTNTCPVKIVGFIKITNLSELEAFDCIRGSGCKFLLDHVILPERSVEMFGHTVIFLPYGGEPLHTHSMRIGPMMGYEMSIAIEILKIFSYLHELRIAHLDIKPGNILWDLSAHTVRVIDFDSSWTFLPHESSKVTGVSGTAGYLAPEVESYEGQLEYDAFLADAHSCGKVLEEMVEEALQSDEKELVRRIAKALTMQVHQRWTIPKALEVLSSYVERRGEHKFLGHSASAAIDDPRFDIAQVDDQLHQLLPHRQ